MDLMNQKNISTLLIGKNIDKTLTYGTSVVDDVTVADTMSTGEFVVTDANNKTITALPANKLIKVGVKTVDGKMQWSEVINTDNVVKAVTSGDNTNSVAPTATYANQVSYIGYNGTTGDIEVINDNLYQLTIELLNVGGKLYGDKIFGVYQSTGSATQKAIAAGLCANLAATQYGSRRQMRFERVCDAAGAAVGTDCGTFTVIYGSNRISATSDIDGYAGGAEHTNELEVGDAIRIGTGVTDPVYIITAVDTTNNNLTIDMPYQGVSQSAIANTAIEVIASATATKWGIKCTALCNDFTPGVFEYVVTRFNINLGNTPSGNFGDTITTEDTTGTEGKGYYKWLKETEWFLVGNWNKPFRAGYPADTYNTNVEDDRYYSIIEIHYYEKDTDRLGAVVEAPRRLILAIRGAANITDGSEQYYGYSAGFKDRDGGAPNAKNTSIDDDTGGSLFNALSLISGVSIVDTSATQADA